MKYDELRARISKYTLSKLKTDAENNHGGKIPNCLRSWLTPVCRMIDDDLDSQRLDRWVDVILKYEKAGVGPEYLLVKIKQVLKICNDD